MTVGAIETALIGLVPPTVASAAVGAFLWLRWRKQRSGEQTSEWARMRNLLDDLTAQRDDARRERDQERKLRLTAEAELRRRLDTGEMLITKPPETPGASP